MSFLTTLASAFKGGGGSRVPVSSGFISPWPSAFESGAARRPFDYGSALREAFVENPVAQRAVRIVAEGVGSAPIGVPANVASNSIAVDPYDKSRVQQLLSEDHEIAAVIVEPLGAGTGKVPISTGFLRQLRDWTSRNDVILIFDEVITGFRVSPGGLQQEIGVTPDLTALAKIVAGGLPGGAVTGRADILAGLDYDPGKRGRREKIFHPGTFNACPVSAAAGLETLNIIQQSNACERANRSAARLRQGLSESIKDFGIDWIVYGEASAFHIYMGGDVSTQDDFDPEGLGREQLYRQPDDIARLLRLALNINGVDFSGWPGGLLSTAHSDANIDATVTAFANSLKMLQPILES